MVAVDLHIRDATKLMKATVVHNTTLTWMSNQWKRKFGKAIFNFDTMFLRLPSAL